MWDDFYIRLLCGLLLPANYLEMIAHIQSLSGLELEMIICNKGALATEFDKLPTFSPKFTPPKWIDLAAIVIHDHAGTMHPPSSSTFNPFHHMELSSHAFLSLSSEEQNQMAMAWLPHALATITNTDSILSILNVLRNTLAKNIADFLTPANITTFLHQSPNTTSTQTYFYRYLLLRLEIMRQDKCTLASGAGSTSSPLATVIIRSDTFLTLLHSAEIVISYWPRCY